MSRTLWNSVAVVSSACVLWALWLEPSPLNDYYRFGYGISGAFCLLAFTIARSKRPGIGMLFLLIGSIAYLVLPARTIARLFLTGDWNLLLSSISATLKVPNMVGYSASQTASWFFDFLIFQLAFTAYFLALLCAIFYMTISKSLRKKIARGA